MTENREKPSVEARLIASMREAVEIAKGRRPAARAYDMPLSGRDIEALPAPAFSAKRIAELRGTLNMSQHVFADVLNVSLGTVRSWEQGLRVPDGAASRLLEIAEADPQTLLTRVQPKGRSAGITPRTLSMVQKRMLGKKSSKAITKRIVHDKVSGKLGVVAKKAPRPTSGKKR